MTTTLLRDEPAVSNMALQDEQDKSKARFTLGGYLFTPPENTVDSFSQGDDNQYEAQAIEGWQKTTLRPIVQTPPASPEFKDTLPGLATATGFATQDSPLFPEQTQSDRTRALVPLFEKELSLSPSPARPTASTQSPEVKTTTPVPQRSRSGVFPFNLNINTGQDALRYYYARMEELRAGRSRELPLPKKSSSSYNLDKESSRQLQSLRGVDRVSKPRPAVRTSAKPKATTTTSPVQTSPPKQRRTPKVKTIDDFYGSAFPPKESSTKHKRAPPSKKVDGENVNWTELPDYAPPISDLDKTGRHLQVTWHGSPLPLTDDPDQAHMHEQEITVASRLRLQPAVYLTNKRKIFQARLQALKDGKNFTKTAAQSACKIDVNKASQLWEAFDKVKWFEPHWFEQYL